MNGTAIPAQSVPAEGTMRVEVDANVATVLLDRPGKLNALTPEMLDALETAVASVDCSEAPRFT